MQLSVPPLKRKTPSPTQSKFGKPSKTPRTPTPSSLTYSYSDTFDNPPSSVNYSDTFESVSKFESTTIKTNIFSNILTELDGDIQTIKEVTKPADSLQTYTDTFETEYSEKEFDSYSATYTEYESGKTTDTKYSRTDSQRTASTNDETQSYRTQTLESVAESTTDRYSSDEFELDDEPYSYSESYEYSSLFEPTDEPSTIIQDPEVLKKEEELRKISEEAKENYITTLINNMRNRRFKDTDITELSLIEPTEVKAEVIDKETDNYSHRFIKRKMALLKHKRKHGRKPVEEKQWPGLQKSCHVTEYGLDPQIIERLKCKNLITNMENASKYDIHDPKRCRECRAYERKIDEEAARRHFIRIKKSQIQKDITENQFQQHLIKMDPINLIGELAKSLPRCTADPAEITEQLNKGLKLSKYL